MRVRSFLMALPLLATGCFILDSADGVKGKGGPFPGGDDDDWAAPLVDGLYEVVDSSVDPMTCGVSTGATLVQFSPVDVVVYSGFVEIVFGDIPIRYEVSGNMLVQGQVEVLGTAGLRLQNLTLTGEAGTVLNPQPGGVGEPP